jgi:hypothetical protein
MFGLSPPPSSITKFDFLLHLELNKTHGNEKTKRRPYSVKGFYLMINYLYETLTGANVQAVTSTISQCQLEEVTIMIPH